MKIMRNHEEVYPIFFFFLKVGSGDHVEGVFEGNHMRGRETSWKSFVVDQQMIVVAIEMEKRG